MLSLPAAILIAGICIGIGLPATVFSILYFAYRMVLMVSVLKRTDTVNDAAYLHRQMGGKKVKPPKEIIESPEIEIGSMAENSKAMENLRKMQDPPDEY